MKARTIAAAVALIGVSAAAWAEQTYDLISGDEYTRSIEAPDDDADFYERAVDPLAPEITVRQPGEASKYSPPIDIEISFRPMAGSSIDLDSLKIAYGSLGINVTKRVLEHATVTPEGILSKGAKLPSGKHKLTVSIADDLGRVGKRRFKFEIVD
jgi:hypothetical protein